MSGGDRPGDPCPRRSSTGPQDGQVLPVFGMLLVVLLGFAALAIDVSGALSARRFYGSAADGAALAGAQDLQVSGSRTVTAAQRIAARQHAMAFLVSALGISGTLPAACGTASDVDVTDECVLPGTTFHVSIRAGTTTGPTAIACQDCAPARSVQVGLRNASYELAFARLFGQSSWNVGVTSVAGLAYGRSYVLATLRPPRPLGNTFDVNDILLNGNNTTVIVHNGDVASNANMTYSGSGAALNIDPGFGMYYFDPYFEPKWYTNPPYPPAQTVERLATMVADPNYRYPAMTGARTAPVYDDARTSRYATLPGVERADEAGTTCAAELAKVDVTKYTFITSYTPDKVYCFNPGVYLSGSGGGKNAQIVIGTGEVGLLKPGAYYLRSGLDVGGNGSRLIGGYEAGQPGVALMFDQTGPGNCSSCTFSGNSADTIALNAGTQFPRGMTGAPATAAVDWDNQLVQTSGSGSPSPAALITMLVRRDTDGPGGTSACTIPTSAPFVEPAGCRDDKNQTIKIGGGGQLHVQGVQYMPTDNVAIAGSSDGKGTIGQIIAWTLTYSGGTTVTLDGAGITSPGVLRLDGACTAPGTPCNP